MILLVKPEATSSFAPFIEDMVKVENVRGDTLSTTGLLAELLKGVQKLACLLYTSDAADE